ncbi:MAG: cysteine desulfurase [Balneolaceae bacterium]
MTQPAGTLALSVDFKKIRSDFPVLDTKVNGKPLSYLDNAASSQMPLQVADRLNRYHRHEHANVHRGIHSLSQKATDAYEGTREKVKNFINASDKHEIVYTTGTTDSINLVANSLGKLHLKKGDQIILSEMEHHANIVPWQMIAEQTGAEIRVIPVNDRGELNLEAYQELLNKKTKIVSIVHVSNALGTVNPVRKIIDFAHQQEAFVVVDGAQAVPHQPVDVQVLDCDFYAFSSHKMCGPTGFGILYGKKELLDEMPPYRGGGDMIDKVTFEKTTYDITPFKFEAGTPPIAAGIGLGTAIDYLKRIGMDNIAKRESELVQYTLERMSQVQGIRLFGTPEKRASVISFNLKDIHAHDVGTILDKQGVAIRTGHHCAQPIIARFNESATARASLSFYNNEEDIDALIDGLIYVKEFFE